MIEHDSDKPFEGLERIKKKQPSDDEYKLSEDDLKKLSALNSRLTEMEKILVKEAKDVEAYATQRVNDVESDIVDFYIDLLVEFDLNENETEYYDENEDNVMTVLHQSVINGSPIYALADGNNHNEFAHWKEHPMFGDEHCWTFHGLYDHSDLTFEDMLKIGSFNFTVNLDLQTV